MIIIKFLVGIIRHWRDAFKSFFRNLALSISALAAINVTLIVVGVSAILGVNMQEFTLNVEEDITIIAYLNREVSEEDKTNLIEDLKSDKIVNQVVYRTKDEELEILISESPELEKVTENYDDGENPLYDTLYIKTKDPAKNEKFAKELEKTNYFYKINAGEEMTKTIIDVFEKVRYLIVGMILALVLVTIFIISNTIRITIFSRKERIDIMRLVGASNYHIRMPYIYEGILIGIFGSLIPVVLIIFGYQYLYDEFTMIIETTPFVELIEPDRIVYYISGLLGIIGVVVGVFGSALSVRKFLGR